MRAGTASMLIREPASGVSALTSSQQYTSVSGTTCRSWPTRTLMTLTARPAARLVTNRRAGQRRVRADEFPAVHERVRHDLPQLAHAHVDDLDGPPGGAPGHDVGDRSADRQFVHASTPTAMTAVSARSRGR